MILATPFKPQERSHGAFGMIFNAIPTSHVDATRSPVMPAEQPRLVRAAKTLRLEIWTALVVRPLVPSGIDRRRDATHQGPIYFGPWPKGLIDEQLIQGTRHAVLGTTTVTKRSGTCVVTKCRE